MNKTVLSDCLVCPICYDIPRAEIYQCKNGHYICRDCQSPVPICPQCRVQRDDMHLRVITTSPAKNLFCSRILGWPECKAVLTGSSVISHLESSHHRDHPIQKVPDSEFQICLDLQDFSPGGQEEDVIFDPLILTSNPIPILLRSVVTKAGGIMLTCFQLSKSGILVRRLVRYQVKYRMELGKGTAIEWSGNVQTYSSFDRMDSINSFSIPLETIKACLGQQCPSNPSKINVKVGVYGAGSMAPEPSLKEGEFRKINLYGENILPDPHQTPTVTFEGVQCIACDRQPIKNIRYKCLHCPNIDLCSRCLELGHHSHHAFVRINDLTQNQPFEQNNFLRRYEFLDEWLNNSSTNQEESS